MTLTTLYDLPVLAPIARAAQHAGVAVELFGSVATCAFLHDQPQLKPDTLFDLVEHVAADGCDHVTITGCPEIADLVHAVLLADDLEDGETARWLSGPAGEVALRPRVE